MVPFIIISHLILLYKHKSYIKMCYYIPLRQAGSSESSQNDKPGVYRDTDCLSQPRLQWRLDTAANWNLRGSIYCTNYCIPSGSPARAPRALAENASSGGSPVCRRTAFMNGRRRRGLLSASGSLLYFAPSRGQARAQNEDKHHSLFACPHSAHSLAHTSGVT